MHASLGFLPEDPLWFFLYKEELKKQYGDAAGRSYDRQCFPTPGQEDANQQCGCPSIGRERCFSDGRKGHDSQCCIRNIVEKAPQKWIGDRSSDQGQREHTEKIADTESNQDIDPYGMCHCPSSPIGFTAAAMPAMSTVRMIVRVPEEREET